MTRVRILVFSLLGLWLLSGSLAVAATLPTSQGQLVYVPVYSHIYFGDRIKTFNLSVTLSIRNIDPKHSIEITSVQYLDEKGKFVRELAPQPQTVGPLAAGRFYIRESDVTGGSEAAFLIRWQAAQSVWPPLIGALMVGTAFGQGISFTTSGQVLEELPGK
jgi:hypothetical protein